MVNSFLLLGAATDQATSMLRTRFHLWEDDLFAVEYPL